MTTAHEGRRLSPLRVTLATLLLGGLVAAGVVSVQAWASAQVTTSEDPWFAGYVDATATPAFAFENPATEESQDVVLSFIVASSDDGCEPTWGNAYGLDEAAESLDLDRRIARLEQRGGGIAVSFGGLTNDELSTVCTDDDALLKAYRSVIERYDVTTIDLDIEGDDLADERGGERRAEAIAALQKERRDADEHLAVWLTLPAATFGLTEEGTTAVQQMLDAGVDIAGVNAMTMNFGESREKGETMAEASIRSLTQTHRQLGVLYELSGTELSDATLWRKIGATPMLGQNDVKTEVFGLDDARELNTWAVKKGLGRMSVWSLNRDVSCGPNYVDLTRVSDACSGIEQGEERFAKLLGDGFDGRAMLSAGRVTTSEPTDPSDYVDDPATSPYTIWDEESSYLKGTKVVWHRNVYEAKWWTKGELPDDPVLNEWETPWTLIGPVLAGEKPIEMPTLALGTYPEWEGMSAYEKGTRVLFEGIPYEAKWWNTGESPEAYSSDPDSSPWVPLTADEIAEIAEAGAPTP
ncbi:chitinase [Diaminobutyricimonas aerilata]|uniref:Chitinase n=1 Tax=Diaminobutyricimonas aerilata TaxID=1162967 RepID=A0A2M9CHR5_9MICO|nr:glycosyl hydrolase family 18 [Diaminobutyricimonas aerilata]PJJ71409.1 chitinase [Diaminobutyricimonas aerilata]